MLRRNLASEFVAGAYVFPGGSVDPDDSRPRGRGPVPGAHRCRGQRHPGRRVGRAGLLGGRPAGVLRGGRGAGGRAVGRTTAPGGGDAARHQRTPEVDGTHSPPTATRSTTRRIGLLDVCRHEDLVLAADTVHYVSHWITPSWRRGATTPVSSSPSAPPGQVAVTTTARPSPPSGSDPADALARFQAPARSRCCRRPSPTSGSLAGFTTSDEVMAWAQAVTDVPTVLPIVVFEDGQVLIFRPGDSGYEDAAARAASGVTPSVGRPPAGAAGSGRLSGAERRVGPTEDGGAVRSAGDLRWGLGLPTRAVGGSTRPRRPPRPGRAGARCSRPWPPPGRWW